MSIYQGFGQLTTDTETDEVAARGTTTISIHLASGTGTFSWEFKGPDGIWRPLLEVSSPLVFTASAMVNVQFGGDARVRGVATSGVSAVWNWQIFGSSLPKA